MNDDYCAFIGKSLDQFTGTDITCVKDDIGIHDAFGGYGCNEDRGVRIYFDKQLLCTKVIIEFDCRNSHDFLGLNQGAKLSDIGSVFGKIDEYGWHSLRGNWFIPEVVAVYILNGNRIEVSAGLISKRIRRIWIEKIA